jgi:hypothetical protein
VKGAMAVNKLPPLEAPIQNSLMAWMGYYLPMNGMSLDRHLYDKFKMKKFELGDQIPLQNPFLSSRDTSEDWF